MTLETLYFITQIIAVVLIFPTLVFLAIQNRQSQKQMERANKVARAEFSGQFMRTNMELAARMIEDVELGRAFRHLTVENKRIEDPDTLFRLTMWFSLYTALWLDMTSADEKGLVDEDVVNVISGTQAFYLTFPVVWDTIPRVFAQRELDGESYKAMMSRMIALRAQAQTHQWEDVANRMKQREAQGPAADTSADTKEELGE